MASPLPHDVMRAIFISSNGVGEEALEYSKEHRKPIPQADEVLIQVKACGVSSFDRRVVAGDLSSFRPSSGILGYEVSGTIEQLGNAVQGYAVGDEVVAALPLDVGGGFAEYISVSSDCVVRRPSTVTDIEGAAIISDGLMAFTALHYKCHVTAGDSILILNAASSHGWMCVQLSAHFGLHIVATANNKDDFNFLNGSGAPIARVIDLTSESFLAISLEETNQIGFDHILQLDPLSSITPVTATNVLRRADLILALAPHGTWVTTEPLQLDPPESNVLLKKGASLAFVFPPVWLLAPTQQGRFLHVLQRIIELAGKGELKARSLTTSPLERARQAVREVGSKPGKLVLRI